MPKKSEQKTIIRRRENKVLGIFIDGTALDRASRRIKRKISLTALLRSLSFGIEPAFARYYTIVPYEDDARHRAFLDAVQRSGLSLLAKRLPPKGITRQVSIEPEMTADMTAFALGHINNYDLSSEKIEVSMQKNTVEENTNGSQNLEALSEANETKLKRSAVIVCPSRELSYAISLLNCLKVDTTSADFSNFAGKDVLKSASKWIDLSDSETIWQD